LGTFPNLGGTEKKMNFDSKRQIGAVIEARPGDLFDNPKRARLQRFLSEVL
jgi:hypothetical protein